MSACEVDLKAVRARSAAFLATSPRHSSSCPKARASASDVPSLCLEVDLLREALRRVVDAWWGPNDVGYAPGVEPLEALAAARALLGADDG